jgi:hypothetical protein
MAVAAEGPAAERGRLLAAALAGAWRVGVQPLTVSAAQLNALSPLFLRSGTAPLAWRRLSGSAVASSPAALALRQAYKLHALEADVHEHLLCRAMAVLGAAGVEALLGKGWAAARLYPEPGLRPYGDIDLYVRPRDHGAAMAALRAPGAPIVPVDLHPGLDEIDDLPVESVFARSRVDDVGGVAVRTFGPEHHLRLLCLHMLRHGAARALWLCDVAAAIETSALDWDLLLAGRRRRSEAVTCALLLAHELLGAQLDGTPLAGRRAELPSWLLPAVLKQWGSGSAWREPIGSYLGRPRDLLRELRRHWPNPIEGTAGVGGPFNALPRLPFQLAHVVVRGAWFSASLPRLMRHVWLAHRR